MKQFIVKYLITSFMLVCAFASSSFSDNKINNSIARYDNYRLYQVLVETTEQNDSLMELKHVSDSYIFIGMGNGNLHVLVAADKIPHFEKFLDRNNISSIIMNYNYQALIDIENKNVKPITTPAKEFDWENYFHLKTINLWLDKIVNEYDFLTLIDIGESYEGRSIRGVKLSRKKGNTGIIVEGGIHAREWITPATITFILNQLITSTDQEIQFFSENFDWYFLPVVNPDGYVFSFEHDRFWRKSRKPFGVCVGVDLNRNFNSHWNQSGSSSNPCANNFCGLSVTSEPETQHLTRFIEDHIKNHNVRTYLSIHSFSQLLMFPYGHSGEAVHNYRELKAIGEKAIDALARRYGTKYQTGSLYETIYPCSGLSIDWVKETFNIPITYTFELRGPRHSPNLFIVPAKEITPIGLETLDAFVTILEEARQLGYYD